MHIHKSIPNELQLQLPLLRKEKCWSKTFRHTRKESDRNGLFC